MGGIVAGARTIFLMQIDLERFASDGESSLSLLSLDGSFECFTLEDGFRKSKVPGVTRISAGDYSVSVRVDSPMVKRYYRKFGPDHRGMLWVRGIPEFTYVYFHIGNLSKHTSGCILPGTGAISDRGDMSVLQSQTAYLSLYNKVINSAFSGKLRLSIVDRDR